MREVERIIEQLRHGFDGDPWHGPSLWDVLDDVEAAQARERPAPEVHTIWEIVLHLTAWIHEITRRLQDGIAQDPADGDWPAVPGSHAGADEDAWAASVRALAAAHGELLTLLAAMEEDVLDARIGDVRDRSLGSGVTRYETLHGLAQHHAYHAGQIVLLKKLV